MLNIQTIFKVDGKEFSSYEDAEKYILNYEIKQERKHIFFYNFKLGHLDEESWDECIDIADYILITTDKAKLLLLEKCPRREFFDIEDLPAPLFLYYDTILEQWADVREHVVYLKDELETYSKVEQMMNFDLKNSEKKI